MTRWRLVAATRNPAKVAQLAELVGQMAEVRPADRDLSPSEDAKIEAGDDLMEIAQRKAVAYSRLEPGCLVVATDGGLMAPALSDWRPARTKRFAGSEASNRGRADALLARAAMLQGDERRIWWREALAVARDGILIAKWTAESPPGLLATDYDSTQLAGDNGFWLPALWRSPEYGGKRLSELTADERAARPDHWQILGRELRDLLSSGRLAPT